MAKSKNKKRGDQTVTVKMPTAWIPLIQARAESLDLNQSQYIRKLVRQDLPAEKQAA